MLDIHYIRKNQDNVIQGLKKKQITDAPALLEQLLAIDQQRRATQVTLEAATAKLRKLTKQVEQLLKAGKKESIAAIKLHSQALKATIQELSSQLTGHEEALKIALYELPNLPHSEVPVGENATQNEVVYQTPNALEVGEKLPHWELATRYNIIDFELGNKLVGTGFPVYKGKGARLQRALIHFFLDQAREAGYEEIQPPILAKQDVMCGTGQLPDKEGQMYQLLDKKLYLIPTAEVPITNLYSHQILSNDALPIKNVAYTPCFRREAGSWGSHVRGLNRLHQFDKVELVEIREPEESYQALEVMRNYVEQLLIKLTLPYRILKVCSGDLGFAAAFTYDLEVFSVGQGRWLEVSSVSNFETYQANRMKLRYKTKDNKIRLLHTLNGSALALPRMLAALLEYNQTERGIIIPDILRSYTRFNYIV